MTFFNDLKNWTSFFLTQRIGLDSKTWTLCFSNLNSKNWTYFDDSQTWSFFLELWHFFEKKKYSKNWTKFFDSKNWTLFLWIWRKELNPFSLIEYDAENWTFWKWRRELNPFSFLPQRIETFSSLPQIIELFFFKKFIDSKNWTFLSDMTQRNEIWKNDSKSWTCFLIWLTELNLFFFHLYDSKNWTLRLNKRLKKSKSSFRKMTQRIEWTLCKRLIELSLFYEPLLNLSWFFFFFKKKKNGLKELNLLWM